MAVPSVSYLEAMEAGQYQRAAQDEALRQAWEEDGDALAHAFLVVAAMHRNAALGDVVKAQERAKDALEVLRGEVNDGWTRKALVQHVQQCAEYLSMGKPLPGLPSGL